MRDSEPIRMAKVAARAGAASNRALLTAGLFAFHEQPPDHCNSHLERSIGGAAEQGQVETTVVETTVVEPTAVETTVVDARSSHRLPVCGGVISAGGDKAQLTVTVGSGAYPLGAEMELTCLDLTGIAGSVVGVAMAVRVNGTEASLRQGRSLVLAIEDPAIRTGDRVSVWDGMEFADITHASVSPGRAEVTLNDTGLVMVFDHEGEQSQPQPSIDLIVGRAPTVKPHSRSIP